MIVEQSAELKLVGKSEYSEKTCPNATFLTTNPTGLDLGSKLDRRGGKPATNNLNLGTAKRVTWTSKNLVLRSAYLKAFLLRFLHTDPVILLTLKDICKPSALNYTQSSRFISTCVESTKKEEDRLQCQPTWEMAPN
jgi:hypothetical protein